MMNHTLPIRFCLILIAVVFLPACVENLPEPVDCRLSDLKLSLDATVDATCTVAEGSITVSATGGRSAYQYQLGTGTFQDNNQFSNLAYGPYTVAVKDADGCLATVETILRNGVVLANIKDIIETNCAINTCHDGSNSKRQNFRIADNIVDNATEINKRISQGVMPPDSSGKSLTDEQKTLISCWVDDGAKK